MILSPSPFLASSFGNGSSVIALDNQRVFNHGEESWKLWFAVETHNKEGIKK